MKEFYYYGRSVFNKPVVTYCLVSDKGKIARGVAICSTTDNPSKTIGRAIAKGRAIKALEAGHDTHPLNRPEAMVVLFGVNPFDKTRFKGQFEPQLDDLEEKLLTKGA